MKRKAMAKKAGKETVNERELGGYRPRGSKGRAAAGKGRGKKEYPPTHLMRITGLFENKNSLSGTPNRDIEDEASGLFIPAGIRFLVLENDKYDPPTSLHVSLEGEE